MSQKTLKDLVEFEKKDKDYFHQCIDILPYEKLKSFIFLYGYNPQNFKKDIPKTIKQFSRGFPHCKNPNEIDESINTLFKDIEEAIKKEEIKKINFLEKDLNEIDDLEHRINLEKINKGDFLKENNDIISKENIIRAIFENKPSREDYIASSVIRPEEFDYVVKRFGLVGIMSNLNSDSREYKDIFSKVTEIQLHLNLLDFKERVKVKEFKKDKPGLYKNIRELFGRYEWALMDLFGHGFKPKDLSKINKEAYILFINNRRDDAEEYMREYNVRPKHRRMFLSKFKKIYDGYRGLSSKVTTSTFENHIRKIFDRLNVFYRRQINYKDIIKTDRKYIADFVVGNIIIEVGSVEDNFIHDENYFRTIADKRELAEKAGYKFYFIDDVDKDYYKKTIKEAIKQAFVPKEVYELIDEPYKKERSKLVPAVDLLTKSLEQPIHSPREIYFASNKYKKRWAVGNMKKKTVSVNP